MSAPTGTDAPSASGALPSPDVAAARAWMARPLTGWTGGRPAAAGGGVVFERYNPADGSPLGPVPAASAADVDAAVRAAAAAGDPDGAWRRLGRRERARTLRAIAEVVRRHEVELATIITLENGKLFGESLLDDMPETADVFDYYAGWTDKLYGETSPVEGDAIALTVREPVGVCALLVPWNFPLLLAAWKIAPALAMGNTVVVKPSPFTPWSVTRFVELVHEEVDLPPGVLNLVTGDAPTGEALVTHPGVAKVSFTGSTGVGRAILGAVARTNLAGVTLELGGKSPNVVFDDVPDLDAAVARSYQAMFSQKGEKCSEPTRFLVQRGVHDAFVDGLVARAGAVRCGDPFDPASDQGAQCNEGQLARILGHIDDASREGATLVAGGERDVTGANADGLFVRPTIFTGVEPTMRLAREEVFGPVLAVEVFDTEDEAVARANATDYGLAAGVYTADLVRARRVAGRLDAGQVFVNHYGCYDLASPFGGFKASGWGKELGRHALDGYTRTKAVWFAG